MMRLSLKTRLVLFHTGLMTLVVCLVLAVLFVLGPNLPLLLMLLGRHRLL